MTEDTYRGAIERALTHHEIAFTAPNDDRAVLGEPIHRKWLIESELGSVAMNNREARAYCLGLADKERQQLTGQQLPSFVGPVGVLVELMEAIEDYSAGATMHGVADTSDPDVTITNYTDLRVAVSRLPGPDSIIRGRLSATTPFGGEILVHALAQPSEQT